MRYIELAFVCLAWVGYGRRMQFSALQLTRSPSAGRQRLLNVAVAPHNRSTGQLVADYALEKMTALSMLLGAYHPAAAFGHYSPTSLPPLGTRGSPASRPTALDDHRSAVTEGSGADLRAIEVRNQSLTALNSQAIRADRLDHQAEPMVRDAPQHQQSADDVVLLTALGREAEAEPLRKDGFEYLLEYVTLNILLVVGVFCSSSAVRQVVSHALPDRRQPPAAPCTAQLLRAQHICMSASTSGATADSVQSTSQGWKRYLPPIKWLVLILLITQNTVTALLARETRQPRADGGLIYLAGVAVLCSECIKMSVCLLKITWDEGGLKGMLGQVRQIFVRFGDTLRMSVPAICYGLQNVLYYVALSHLSATSYQLFSQSKTLFTALFFVNMLGKVLRWPQWIALAFLPVGVCLVQFGERSAAAAGAVGSVAATAGSTVWIGIAAVLTSSLLAAFANVYFEKVVKTAQCEYDKNCEMDGANQAPLSIWVRNVQLGIFSIPQAVIVLLLSPKSREVIAAHGLFAGFTPAVWLVTALIALGGLIVALVVKYADNLLKTYATAMSILLTCMITSINTGVMPSARFIQGMSIVLFSMGLYNGVGPLGWWKRTAAETPVDAVSGDKEAKGS